MPEPTVPILEAAVDPDLADPCDELLLAAERGGMSAERLVATVLAVLRRLAADGRITQDAVQGVAAEFATSIRWRATT